MFTPSNTGKDQQVRKGIVYIPQSKKNKEVKWHLVVMDREAWRAVIHGVAKRQTQPSDWTELNWTDPSIKDDSSS